MDKLTIIVVSDYETGDSKSWSDERKILQALANQDTNESFSVLIVENDHWSSSVPADLFQIFSSLELKFVDDKRSSLMINSVVPYIHSDYIAIMEADCIPSANWVRELKSVLDENDQISIVSGKTNYGKNTISKRIFSLLHRAYEDQGKSGITTFISNNGAIYRRSILLKYPYPYDITPFASARLRNQKIRKDELKCFFQNTVEMIHAFDGLKFVLDFHRNAGYAAVSVRKNNLLTAIPIAFISSYENKLTVLLFKSKNYLKLYDYPLAICLALFLPFLELYGMLDCLRNMKEIPKSMYR